MPSLHPWDGFHLIMLYDLFNVLLDMVCQYFVEDFSTYVHQLYWPIVFLLSYVFTWFWNWPHRGWECYFLTFLEKFENCRIQLITKCMIKLPYEAVQCRALVFQEFFDNSFNFTSCCQSMQAFCFFLIQF